MRVLIYEFFSAGAMDDNQNLFLLGFSMINALFSDFSRIPNLEISTILHSRVKHLILQASYASRVYISWTGEGTGTWFDQYEKMVESCDAVLVIAPETDGLLAKLIGVAERKEKKVLGSTSKAVELVSDKAETIKLLASYGLPVPYTEKLTWPLHSHSHWQASAVERFSMPIVLKPVTGTGGQGVMVIKDPNRLDRAVKQFEGVSGTTPFLVQEYISGESVSVSCLVTAGKVLPLSLNRQHIALGEELNFQGISIPYKHPQAKEALDIAKRACEVVDGLSGFVGVDLVLGLTGPVIMEINSRISVAYVALREVVKRNLAHDLWLTCMEQRLPTPPELNGTYTYRMGL